MGDHFQGVEHSSNFPTEKYSSKTADDKGFTHADRPLARTGTAIPFGANTCADDRPLASPGTTILHENDARADDPPDAPQETTTLHESFPGEPEAEEAKDKIEKFHVGGRVFMTWSSTLRNPAVNTKLADQDFLSDKYDASRDAYFLDRDPEVFSCVLNFLRSGHLHLPSTLCGPHVKEELAYWGVSPLHIEPCCWQTFNSWTSVMTSVKRLERDSKLGVTATDRDGSSRDGEDESQVPKCQVWSRHVWSTLTNPRYSFLAKIYGWVSLYFIVLAIFSFCAATHMAFRVPRPLSASAVTSQDVSNVITSSPTQGPSHKTVEDRLSETEVHPVLWCLDLVCLIFFTAELVTKIICAPNGWKYLRSINGIVDFLALCPEYVEMIVMAVDPNDLQGESRYLLFLPFLRIMRVFRIFRLVRHIPGLWVMIYTLQASYKELFLMLAVLFVGTLLFASIIFFVDDKEMFPSIPQGFWWAIITMTTVGYGDMHPVTPWGYVLGSLTAVSGVLVIGFTVPALVNNFSLYYNHAQFVLQREKLQRDLEEEKAQKEKEEEEKAEKEKEEEKNAEETKRKAGMADFRNGGSLVHEAISLRAMTNGHHRMEATEEAWMHEGVNEKTEERTDEQEGMKEERKEGFTEERGKDGMKNERNEEGRKEGRKNEGYEEDEEE